MASQHLPHKSLAKSFLTGMTWRFFSLYSQAFLNLIVLATLSRLLSPEDFGVMGIASIFVGLAELVSEMGVGPAIIQHQQPTSNHLRVGFTIAVLLGIMLLVILWTIAPLIALFFQNEQITPVVRGVSLAFVFGSFGVVSEGLLRRRLEFRKLMGVNVGSYAFGYALVGLGLAWSGYGVWALVGATLSQSLLKSALLLWAASHPFKPSFALPELRELIHFGGGITLARLFNYGAGQGDYFVVGRVLGTEILGIYTRAYRLMNLPANYLGRVLDTVLFPVMAKIQHELPRLTKSYLTGIAMISLVCAPTGIFMVIMAPEIVNVVLGPKWTETIIPFQILALGVLPRVSYKIDNSLARAMGAVYQRSLRDAIYAAMVVLGAILGLRWGLSGVALGVLGALILNNILALRMSLNLLGCSLEEYVKAQLPGLLLVVVTAFVAVPTRLLFHAYGSPDWFILIITMLISGLSLFGLFFWQPQKILGGYGTGALVMIIHSVPSRFLPKLVSQWFHTKIVERAA
jgi:O-antigen/teichoic acid export membrane protein